jgi:hypothetical protein
MNVAPMGATAAPTSSATVAALGNAADAIDSVLKVLTPNPDPKAPKQPTLQWGNDLGIYGKLNSAANDLDTGRDGITLVFTRHQAGPLFDSLAGDTVSIQHLRDAALAISEGKALGDYAPAPTLNDTALQQLAQAAADARAAAKLLTTPAG